MNSLAIGDKLQTIKEIAIGGCEDIEVSEKIFDLCDEISGLVNSVSCNCKHNSKPRDNKPCCRCNSRHTNAEIVKVDSLEIIVRMIDNKPYYEVKYREVGEKDYSVGYSSYDLKIVLGFIAEYFEIVESDKHTNADRIRNMSDEELAEWINTKSMCEQCANYYEPESECMGEPCTSGILRWLQSEAE